MSPMWRANTNAEWDVSFATFARFAALVSRLDGELLALPVAIFGAVSSFDGEPLALPVAIFGTPADGSSFEGELFVLLVAIFGAPAVGELAKFGTLVSHFVGE